MFSTKNKKRAFTLIEMLIVIVIIGILAAALIPRLSSARGRANDVARKADLAQVAAALVSYQIDHGSFPSGPAQLNNNILKQALEGAGMSSIPTDPNTSRTFSAGIDSVNASGGQYAYTPIKKGGIERNGFVVMAATETEGGSNRVATSNNSIGNANIGITTEYEDIVLCKSFVTDTNDDNPQNGICYYNKNNDELRYIYLY